MGAWAENRKPAAGPVLRLASPSWSLPWWARASCVAIVVVALVHLAVNLSDRASCAVRGVTRSGAFCYTAADPFVGGNHLWCRPLAEALSILFAERSVIDLGGGLGRYTHYFRNRRPRLVGPARCVDGAPNVREATGGVCEHMDLARPARALGNGSALRADWALSLEVGEHIPRRYTAAFLDNLDRANRRGIVLSWAVPGQGGFHHTNELPNKQVIALVEKRGYAHDAALTRFLRGRAVGWRSCQWFRNSLLAFRRRGSGDTGHNATDRWAKFFQ